MLYTNSKAAVLVGGKLSRYFDIWSGVLQGDVLAPYLFIIVVDYVMSRSEGDFGFIYKTGTSRTKRKLNDLDYAYDIALLDMSIAKAAEQLLCRRSKLVVNTEKTEYMCVNVHEDADLMSLNGKRINKVSDFKYLGSKVSSTKNDLAHRRSLAWAAFKKLDKIWLAKHVSVKLKVNILRASVFSVLLYGSET